MLTTYEETLLTISANNSVFFYLLIEVYKNWNSLRRTYASDLDICAVPATLTFTAYHKICPGPNFGFKVGPKQIFGLASKVGLA